MASNYKDFLDFTCNLNLKLENKDHKCIIASNNNAIIFDRPRDDDNEKIYFLRLEKMYLDNMHFPIIANKTGAEMTIKLALVNYYYKDGDYHRLRARNIIELKDMKISPYQTFLSPSMLCAQINKFINFYESTLSKDLFEHLYYPCFGVKEGKLVCNILYRGGKLQDSTFYGIGFNQNLYDVIGKYFDCEWGFRDERDEGYDPNVLSNKTERFYVIHPFLQEHFLAVNRYLSGVDITVTATHHTDDFFYPERNLDLEFTRNSNSLFDGTAPSYKKFSFPFRNKESIVDINKQILIANNTTIREANVTRHIFRMSVEIDEKYLCNDALNIKITGKLLPYEDIYDQFSLYNLNIYDLYTDDQLLTLTYKQIEGMQADKVYVQNQENTKALKEMRDLLLSIFDPFTEKDDCNIPRVLRRIYDILCQTQEITNMGPPLKQKIKYSLDF